MLEPRPLGEFDPRVRGEARSAALGNRLLDALVPAERESLRPFLRRVFLMREQQLVVPNEPVTALHFPIDAFIWNWAQTTDTVRPTSIFTVGHRGVVELGRALGYTRGVSTATVISPGSAWRLQAEALDDTSRAGPALRRLVLRFAHATILSSACRLACNSEHNVDQRLARWLLWVADESARDEFAITHAQIAEIAAIRRPSVSLELSRLQREGIVRSQHGRLRVIGRAQLEAMVCRCYWSIRQNTEAIF